MIQGYFKNESKPAFHAKAQRRKDRVIGRGIKAAALSGKKLIISFDPLKIERILYFSS
jgi:hypothetical protein